MISSGDIVVVNSDCNYKNKLTIVIRCINEDSYKLFIDRGSRIWNKNELKELDFNKDYKLFSRIMEENQKEFWK